MSVAPWKLSQREEPQVCLQVWGWTRLCPSLCPPGKPPVYTQGTQVGWASPLGQVLASLPPHQRPPLGRPAPAPPTAGPRPRRAPQTFREQLGHRRRETWSVPGAAGLQGGWGLSPPTLPAARGPGSLWPRSALKWAGGVGFSGPVDQQGAVKKAQRAERTRAGGIPCSTKPSGHQAVLSVLRARGSLGVRPSR